MGPCNMFVCPSLGDLRLRLNDVLGRLDVPHDVPSILSTQHRSAVHAMLHFFKETNFIIQVCVVWDSSVRLS